MTIQELEQLLTAQGEELRKVNQFISMLQSANSIPLKIDQAFRARFRDFPASDKATSTETQAVSEGGSANYSVAKPMDGFIKISVGGVIKNIPFYD